MRDETQQWPGGWEKSALHIWRHSPNTGVHTTGGPGPVLHQSGSEFWFIFFKRRADKPLRVHRGTPKHHIDSESSLSLRFRNKDLERKTWKCNKKYCIYTFLITFYLSLFYIFPIIFIYIYIWYVCIIDWLFCPLSMHSSPTCLDFHSSEQKKDNQPFQRRSCLVHLQPLQPSEETIN